MAGDGTNWHMATGSPSGPSTNGEQQAGVTGVEEPAQHHGEAALLLAPPALGHELDQAGAASSGARCAGSRKRTV